MDGYDVEFWTKVGATASQNHKSEHTSESFGSISCALAIKTSI